MCERAALCARARCWLEVRVSRDAFSVRRLALQGGRGANEYLRKLFPTLVNLTERPWLDVRRAWL